jgi:hypothetical protein
LENYAIGSQNRGVKGIRAAFIDLFERKRVIRQAIGGRLLLRRVLGVNGALANLSVHSLSPSDSEHELFLRDIASQVPQLRAPHLAAVSRTPNLASVVLALEWDHCSALLGADMERRSEPDRGWNAVITESTRLALRQAGVVKVPHHGSENAHQEQMWKSMLIPLPLAVLAPFGKGEREGRPPTKSDMLRIKALSSKLFVTAPHASARPQVREPAVTRGLREGGIKTRSLNTAMGIVRFRKTSGSDWAHELFGPAFLAA